MRRVLAGLLFTLLLVMASEIEAGLFPGKCKPPGCCDHVECGPCGYACCPEAKTEKVKKHCWETECEAICVPRVQCPLFNFFRKDKCDPCTELDASGRPLSSLGSDVRMVKKLKKVEYECEKCVVEWKVQKVSPGCAKCGAGTGAPGDCCKIK